MNNLDFAKKMREQATQLCSEQEVEQALAVMAKAITAELAATNPLVLCIMTGAIVFAGKLLPRLDFPLEIDYIHVSRYRKKTTGFELQWLVKPHSALQDRTVLILDDILDEGYTLAAIKDYCQQEGAAKVYSAVLVEKLHERKVSPTLKADFTGMQIKDYYLFGYGMDCQGYWRNASGIYAVSEEFLTK